jgi:hypothetical protein
MSPLGRYLLGIIFAVLIIAIVTLTGCTQVSVQVGDGNKKEPNVDIGVIKSSGKEK